MEMAIGFVIVCLALVLAVRWLNAREDGDKEPRDGAYENIERLEGSANLLQFCSWIALVLVVGVPVYSMTRALIYIPVTEAFAYVALRAGVHLLHAAADILEGQIKTAARLAEQDKMLKSIGRMLQQQQRERLEDTPVNLSSVPKQ